MTILGGPRSLGDAANLLASWEAGLQAPAPVRGAAVLAKLRPEGEAVLDLPLPDVAALAVACLAEVSGDDVEGVLACGTCGTLLEVRVRLPDLLGEPPVPEPRARGRPARVAVRPPTPRDLAAAAVDDDARAVLVRRCVTRADGAAVDPATLSPADLAEIDEALESLAGQALPVVRAACPDCGGTASGAVDAADLLWRHVEAAAAAVLRDVARLATAFGWREPDVLALTTYRRSAYLSLVTR